jgi:septum formation protein
MTSRIQIILASTSEARQALLRQVGLAFEAVSPDVPEPLERLRDPAAQARRFARDKAAAVAQRFPGRIVVGADQVLSLDGEAWGKPADAEAAFDQLSRLSGRRHTLVTAIAIADGAGGFVEDAEETELTVRSLSEAELRAYVATGEWHGCAGSYRLEGRGLALFEAISGDPTNVLGLPMPRLLTHLRALGVPLF